jgi:lipopolysaccharide/colanic/teichoic acid biosynthesis glycosyltransferase
MGREIRGTNPVLQLPAPGTPGITGWAQVNDSYGANVEDARIKLRYDLYYVKYLSFMMYLNITFKTIYVMIFGKGR